MYPFEKKMSGFRFVACRRSQFLPLLAMLALLPTLLLAKVTGSISGTARDSSGAVIPGVQVQARNTQTGVLNGDNHEFEALSQFDVPQSFSASYTVELPFDKLFHSNNRGIRGWKISGITTFATG